MENEGPSAKRIMSALQCTLTGTHFSRRCISPLLVPGIYNYHIKGANANLSGTFQDIRIQEIYSKSRAIMQRPSLERTALTESG